MTPIPELLRHGPSTSFEFFPPRTAEAETVLEETLVALAPLSPTFVSVTYGAGGTTRERTHDLVVRIDRMPGMTAMAHLTCVGHTRAELEAIVTRYRDEGVVNILALGGDPPADADVAPGELEHAVELVRLAREVGGVAIGVAAFPEPHPRSPDLATDRRFTAEKLAEADFAITQFFFEAHHYFDLVSSLADLGVDRPVLPGIMPVQSLSAIKRMAAMQGSDFPAWLEERLRAVGDDPEAVRRVGIEEATRLCRELLDGGAPGLHFYTLNRSPATREISANLGLIPA